METLYPRITTASWVRNEMTEFQTIKPFKPFKPSTREKYVTKALLSSNKQLQFLDWPYFFIMGTSAFLVAIFNVSLLWWQRLWHLKPGQLKWVAWTETTTQMGPTGFRLEVVLRCWIPPYSDPKWMDSTLNHTKPGFRLGMFGGSELGGMDYQGLLGLLQNRSGVCRCMHMVQVHNDIHTFNIIIIYIIYNITIEAIQKYS